MRISIQESASFLASNYRVFDELWRRQTDPLTDAELIAIIGASEPQTTPSYLLAQLKKLRFIGEADSQAGTWELTPPFARWLEHLQQIARPISSAVVQGRLTALEQALAAFTAARSKNDLAEGRDLLSEAHQAFQSLTEDLAQTRAAIANEVSEVKTEHRAQSATERFRRINRLWQGYLMPMLNLLDPSGSLEVICSGWERELALSLERRFLPNRRLAERLEREMQIVRVALRQSFRACQSELAPLHASLRRDSLWAEGAARILANVERDGISAINPATALPLSRFRFANQMSNAALEASAARWCEISAPVEVIDFVGTPTPADAQAIEEILAAFDVRSAQHFPIPDLLAWLSDEFGTHGFYPVLQVFSLLVTDSKYLASFCQPMTEYPVADGVVRCGRVTLALRSAA